MFYSVSWYAWLIQSVLFPGFAGPQLSLGLKTPVNDFSAKNECINQRGICARANAVRTHPPICAASGYWKP